MKKSIMKRIVCFVCLILLLVGCAKSEEAQTQDQEVKKDELLIGMSFDSFLIERWQTDRDFFVDAATEQGATVNVQNANGDVETQIAQIRYLIQKPVDVLVIVSIDAATITGYR